ncbi:MAG: glycosyltransferase family 39 protein [Bacteroidales bacterium]|nr:glycosyltransferase family 39 protein [Bacteroidales bacterium]
MMQTGLLKRINKVYIVSGILLYLILFFYWKFPLSPYNALILVTFTAFSAVVYRSLTINEEKLTSRRLAITVFVFSFVFVALYLLISYYYTGNTFIFSEQDARIYEELSYKIKDMPNKDIIYYLTVIEDLEYDDLGAPIVMSYLMKIVPSKEFINLFFIILNTISAWMLFSIGRSLMSKRYAYTASLAYSISSYTIFFMGSFLKEILLLFLVIACIFCLYRHKATKHTRNIVLGLVMSALLFFFRPAVTFGLWLAYLVYYLFVEKRRVLVIFFSVFGILIIYLAFRLIVENYYRYSTGGESVNVTSSFFNRLVFILGGLIGPFPHLLQTGDEITFKPLYGPGLMYKLFLFFAFWKGVFYSFKKRDHDVLPMIAYVVLESLGLIIAMDSLELRKALPHFPFFLLVAFWWIDKYDKSRGGMFKKTDSLWFIIYTAASIFIILGWNILN